MAGQAPTPGVLGSPDTAPEGQLRHPGDANSPGRLYWKQFDVKDHIMLRRLNTLLGVLAALVLGAGPALAEPFKLGLAYDVSRSGHGFDLHKAGDTYVLFFYTYDSQGDPEWLLGTGVLVDGVISGDLDRYLYTPGVPGSQTPDPAFRGRFRLDASEAAVEGACNDGVSRARPEQLTSFYWEADGDTGVWCTQFLFGGDEAAAPYHGGVWYAGGGDSGYGFSMAQEGDTRSAVVYYYDGEGQPRWSLGLGAAGEVIDLDHYTGFCRTCTPVPTESEPAGTLALSWSGDGGPGEPFGQATLLQTYPRAPFGDFDRDFDLYRLSDGQATGERTPRAISTQAFFDTFISPAIVQARCINCHVEDGPSGHTRLVFQPPDVADFQALNLAKFEALVAEEGADYILTKIRGGNGHGGGPQVPGDSLEFADMVLFFQVMTGEVGPGGPQVDLFEKVTLLSWPDTLRKAALLFAGRLPTAAETQVARGDDEAAFRQVLRGLLQGDGFKTFLTEGANDRLLTDKWLRRQFVDARFNPLYPDYNRMVIENYLETQALWDAGRWEEAEREWERVQGNLQRASAREPLELIAHVVLEDKPYTEILTADYTMVNPVLSEAYGSGVSFDNPGDPDEWRPGRNDGQVSPDDSLQVYHDSNYAEYRSGGIPVDYPHAGVLNTPALLARYPSTATNRNRARARWTYYFFLGVDIEAAASRPTDPDALADRNNPTLNNPACAACHTLMDPVAGTYQNYGDVGLYRDAWGGQDSLPDTYKHEWESPYVPGDTWYRDMRTPGFNGQAAPDPDNSLQWLADRITGDPRFAAATVSFWWPAVIGRDPLRPPQEATDADYPARLAAFEAQNGYIEALGERFRTGDLGASPYRLKDLLVEMAMGPWFRAAGTSAALTDEEAEVLDLAEVSGERLLTPRQLDRKIQAVTGHYWQRWDLDRRPGKYETGFSNHYRLYYGGIDSDGITRRQREMTSIMSTVVAAFAAQSACPLIAEDMARPANQRLLFNQVSPELSPATETAGSLPVAAEDGESAETFSVTATVNAGEKRLRVGFENDYSDNDGDRNLYVHEMRAYLDDVLVADFDLSDAEAIEGFASDNGCNESGNGRYNLWCRGSFSVPLVVGAAGELKLEVTAHASRGGDELARLGLAIEAADPYAETQSSLQIRQQLVRWFNRMLGVNAGPQSGEITRVMNLLRETQAAALASEDRDLSCRWRTGLADPQAMLPAWQTALVYVLTDYRFLYE